MEKPSKPASIVSATRKCNLIFSKTKYLPTWKDLSRMSTNGHHCEGSCHSLLRSSMKQQSENTLQESSYAGSVVLQRSFRELNYWQLVQNSRRGERNM
jgi:hypothetical protein